MHPQMTSAIQEDGEEQLHPRMTSETLITACCGCLFMLNHNIQCSPYT